MSRQYLEISPLGLAGIAQFTVGLIVSVILVLLSMRA